MGATSRMALVGDIGGTNARFAITDIDELSIMHFAALRCDMFPSLQAAIKAYMNSIPHRPSMAAFAIAGPVRSEVVRMTNLPWSFSREDLRSVSGADTIHLVNDFEALAMVLPHLTAHDLHKLGGGEPVEGATKVVLGPGTGLGVAGLVSSPSGWISVPGEGGHISFAAEDVEELAIREKMTGDKGHVSAERMISGPGLVRLYQVLGQMKGVKPDPLSAAEIAARALGDKENLAEEALGYFKTWLGRFAGDMALAYGAQGGVYLGGGMAPRIFDEAAASAFDLAFFHRAFQAKGRLSAYLASIPVYTIRAADAGLRGAAVALSAAIPARMSP